MKVLIKTLLFVICLFSAGTAVSDAQVKAWGNNISGQLGNGTTSNYQPAPVSISQNQTTGISGGLDHTLFLQANGTVLGAGTNRGVLGNGGPFVDEPVPVMMSGISTAVQVSAGGYQSFVLLADGTVRACGMNSNGELGDGTTTQRFTPVAVSGLTNVIAVDGGFAHALALKSDGTVWAWGRNFYGQLGDNTTTNKLTPVQVANLNNVIAISAGERHSIALKADGTVWVWGGNAEGQLGNNTSGANVLVPAQTSIAGVSQIAAGAYHNIALKPDGTVWIWGENEIGQVGNGTTGTPQLTPVQNTTINGAVDIRTNGYTNYVRLRDGSIRAWGYNGEEGSIGNGTTNTATPYAVPTPVQTLVGAGNVVLGAGYFHALVSNPQITTPVGANQFFQGDSLKLNFANVTAAGTTSYTQIDPTGAAVTSLTLPAGYTIQNNEPAYNITTTATFTGNIQTCVRLNGEYNAANLSKFKLMHGEGGALVDRTTSVDLKTRQLCASTATLSPFVVALGPVATAAEASISGRVLSSGKGPANARVELTGTGGLTKTVLTNAFGNFTIGDVEAGATYVVNVSAKKYTFAPQIVSVTDNVSGLIFTAQ